MTQKEIYVLIVKYKNWNIDLKNQQHLKCLLSLQHKILKYNIDFEELLQRSTHRTFRSFISQVNKTISFPQLEKNSFTSQLKKSILIEKRIQQISSFWKISKEEAEKILNKFVKGDY